MGEGELPAELAAALKSGDTGTSLPDNLFTKELPPQPKPEIKTEPKPEPKQVGVSLADLLKQKVGKGGIGRLKEMGTPEDEVAPPVIKIPQTTKQ
ncbi:hypothetical protein A2334_05810 [Candidatus Roizmanbacteria bacterium RIFOXYB2_FULL_38_10]|uniref:Uncharacterized protein n=1 Tax=Candidatus Roizmanbacteria bacterium RIFOXYD1_FULL_38_12 TaxID=1802093 RepID=A0A1F7L0Z1_9BACT|nr:MAG: hypothetical protein A3K47_02930 [Candidatus Roizmanbacteria bacterium RIFOXYA2_FULL_38_14]OGK63721.1 MAG: hypothetical protein A3K27_02930 [Candidatus Roizmanbacteria bacterium RIFOXYA1_FULL_37_12]OGK65567.1 MAG: hypothetical protein A3K38_02930 [Candidatus Roizmanbacteria bacterium RIFOXYB1_FULL_40_23]OGK68351.1 MAG: hypothetical protein A2334_05810 [Candidatus Roizmanbacteria bacterium RIFOXYB2_FULL_38_10]OGK69972.1 MAG: hypothetical protein A3K21_02935 [Candidatus Roizmanbacteria ba